jgi:galactonate dehydratase
MKIKEIKTWIIDCYRTNWIIIKILTDEGLYGIGEATLEYREKSVLTAVDEIAEDIKGNNPFEIEKNHNIIRRDSYYRSGPVLSTALGAIDMALWDLKAKALNVPVYELLGGKIRDKLLLYANGWFSGSSEPEEFAEKAAATVAQGFRALKWDPFGSMYLEVTSKDLMQIAKNVNAVREAVGDNIDLIIEGHGRFNMTAAKKIASVIKDCRPTWFEEPLIPGNAKALSELRRSCDIPLAAGERAYSIFDVQELLNNNSIDVIQSDVSHVGGITELKRIGALAMANSISVSPHNPNGPVSNMATMHYAATCENFNFLETMNTDVPWRKDIFNENVVFEDGFFIIPDEPGLCIDIKEKEMDKYPYSKKSIRHYQGTLTSIRPANCVQWYK